MGVKANSNPKGSRRIQRKVRGKIDLVWCGWEIDQIRASRCPRVTLRHKRARALGKAE